MSNSGLLRSTLFLKAVMGVSGLLLFGFVLGHMSGNLKAFQGAETFNAYAHGIRELGYPFLPHQGFLWIARLGLLMLAGLHIWSATRLTFINRAARPQDYAHRRGVQLDFASRTMRFSGFILFFYVVYHLLHLTVGSVHSEFIPGDAYHNLVTGLSVWPIAVFYIIANLLLGIHLYHGLWSLFQSLGINHPSINGYRRPFAVVFAAVVTAGFLSVPLGVLSGVIA